MSRPLRLAQAPSMTRPLTTPPNPFASGAILIMGLLAGCPTVAAHEAWPGAPTLVSAIYHPLASLDLALMLAAYALLLGAASPRGAPFMGCIAALPSLAAGFAAQPWVLSVPGLWRLPLACSLAAGTLAAAGWRPTGTTAAAAGLLIGLVLGLGASQERPGMTAAIETIAGSGLALALIVMLVALPCRLADRYWSPLPGRIAGAWIAAISLLGLAAGLR